MRPRGFTLLAVLWFAGMWLCLSMAGVTIVSGIRQRVVHNKMDQEAATWARSGADYAAVMIQSGRWNGLQEFQAPDMDGTRRFTIYLRRDAHTTFIRSVGEAGGIRHTVERRLP